MDNIDELPPHRLYPYMEKVNGKEFMYCFDIEEIHDYIKRERQNPYTRQPISSDDINDINKAYKKYLIVTGKQLRNGDIELINQERPHRVVLSRLSLTPTQPPQPIQPIQYTHRYRTPMSEFLDDKARRGLYTYFENMSDEELLSLNENSKSYYYYLVYSQKYDAIIWLLRKPIVPPEYVIAITNRYRPAFTLKMRNPMLTPDDDEMYRLLPSY